MKVNNPFKIQDRLMDFNGTEFEKFIDIISHSAFIRILLPFPITYLSIKFDFLHVLKQNNISQQIECRADISIWMPSMKSDINDVCKHKTMLLLSILFLVLKIFF